MTKTSPLPKPKQFGVSSSASYRKQSNAYADIKQLYKHNRSPPAEKIKRNKLKELPAPGCGKYNRIYTVCCMDGSDIVFVMHKRNHNEFAFTKVIDNMIGDEPALKSIFGFHNVFMRVDPHDGKKPLATNTKQRYPTIYHRKLNGVSTKERREQWAEKVLVPLFNKFGQTKYRDGKYGDEKFQYGGDLETSTWCDYLGDFITNQDVADVMKNDVIYSGMQLVPANMARDQALVKMYYGPEKVDEGIATLLSQKTMSTATGSNKSIMFHLGDYKVRYKVVFNV